MKLSIACLLLIAAVSAAPLEGSAPIEGSELVHNSAFEEYDEFGQELAPSGDYWINKRTAGGKSKFGDAKYHAGANLYRNGMVPTTSFRKSMKALKAATKRFKEAKARYTLKKGCQRIKQCRTRKCVGKKAKAAKKLAKNMAKSGMGPHAHIMGGGGGVRLWGRGKSDYLSKLWAKKARKTASLVQKQPWIRRLPCQRKVCRWITKCNQKKVKAYERKQKKQEAAIAKRSEARYMKEVTQKGGKKGRKKGGKKGGKKGKKKSKKKSKKGKKKTAETDFVETSMFNF